MDRISNLPDSLLYHILSFLPTKTSVATSLISRRWRHLWQHLQVFNLKQDLEGDGDSDYFREHFSVFVNRVLALRKERDIQKFTLSCSYASTSFYDHSLTCWILAAAGPHLQEMDISLPSEDLDYSFCLPHCVLTCPSLVSLTLVGGISIENVPSVSLPSLKTLNLTIDQVSPIDRLLSGCPVLETLVLFFSIENAPKLRMPSSLKSLTFVDRSSTDNIDELEIDTPALEFLRIGMNSRCHLFTFKNLHNVMEAHLNFFHQFLWVDERVYLIVRLLKALYRTKSLFLCSVSTECLLGAPTEEFPKFSCLLHLHLDISCFNSSFMINLLNNCHMLQVFKTHSTQKTSVRVRYPSGWTHPTIVPSCLVSQLTTIEFGTYKGSKDEQAFTAYVLQSGLVLKTVVVRFSSDIRHRDNIIKELCASPRGSSTCRLELIY